MLRNLLVTVATGAALLAAAPALAVDFNVTADLADGTASFGNSYGAAGNGYSDRIFFTLTGAPQVVTAQVSSINNPLVPPYDADFDFNSVGLFSSAGTLLQAFTNTMPNDPIKMQISSSVLAAGTYYIGVVGSITPPATNGGYSGTINTFTPTAAVPEPATWGMMLLGFGLIGAATRRNRRINYVTA